MEKKGKGNKSPKSTEKVVYKPTPEDEAALEQRFIEYGRSIAKPKPGEVLEVKRIKVFKTLVFIEWTNGKVKDFGRSFTAVINHD